jgi:peptide deformylase
MPLEIVKVPARVLSRPARRVSPRDNIDLHHLYDQMFETMDERGVGLAAPQVGKSIRFCLAMNPETGEVDPYVNPTIVQASPEVEVGPEGCLSIPGFHAFVERAVSITVSYQDLDFKERRRTLSGYHARILQHEIDHLQGVLITQRAIDGLHPDRDDEETEEVDAPPEGVDAISVEDN